MTYRITGLSADPFIPLYGLSDADLARRGVQRQRVTACPGFPDRITMRDMPVGAYALLLNYEHLPVASPYRSSHAIFVLEGARETASVCDEVPEVMSRRTLSLRSYNVDGMMLDATLAEADGIDPAIRRLLDNPAASYLHAHNAIRGCYSGRIDRAQPGVRA